MKSAPQPVAARQDWLLRDAAIIAKNELQDAMRSRRALVVILLFLVGAVAGTLLSVAFIHSIERSLARALILEPTDGTGSMTATLWKNKSFKETVVSLVNDGDLAEALLSAPPLSLFYCGIVFFFTPLLVVMTSSHRLTEDIWTGASRFVLFRTSRLAWCLGKFGGQAFLLMVALLLSVPAAWFCGLIRMDDYPAAATLLAMLVFALKAWVYALAYLGLVSGLSLYVKNPGLATAIGVMGLVIVSAVFHLAGHYVGNGWRVLFELPRMFTPQAYYMDLLRPTLANVFPAVVSLIVLSMAFLLAGYARLKRRDV